MRKSNPTSVLHAIEQAALKAAERIARKFDAKRAKVLKRLFAPLHRERKQLMKRVNEIDRELAKVSGKSGRRKASSRPRGQTVKRRKRLPRAERMQAAATIYAKLQKHKQPMKSGELDALAKGVPVRLLIKLWNKTHSDRKIKCTGSRATMKYSA